jgi:hypothetical protein
MADAMEETFTDGFSGQVKCMFTMCPFCKTNTIQNTYQ